LFKHTRGKYPHAAATIYIKTEENGSNRKRNKTKTIVTTNQLKSTLKKYKPEGGKKKRRTNVQNDGTLARKWYERYTNDEDDDIVDRWRYRLSTIRWYFNPCNQIIYWCRQDQKWLNYERIAKGESLRIQKYKVLAFLQSSSVSSVFVGFVKFRHSFSNFTLYRYVRQLFESL
jgi:hypothetical protein